MLGKQSLKNLLQVFFSPALSRPWNHIQPPQFLPPQCPVSERWLKALVYWNLKRWPGLLRSRFPAIKLRSEEKKGSCVHVERDLIRRFQWVSDESHRFKTVVFHPNIYFAVHIKKSVLLLPEDERSFLFLKIINKLQIKRTEVLVPETQLSQVLFLYIKLKLRLWNSATIYVLVK